MSRILLHLGQASFALAVFLVVRSVRNAHKPIPVSRAADMLRIAWADNHTRA
jgi:hypothetical protein